MLLRDKEKLLCLDSLLDLVLEAHEHEFEEYLHRVIFQSPIAALRHFTENLTRALK